MRREQDIERNILSVIIISLQLYVRHRLLKKSSDDAYPTFLNFVVADRLYGKNIRQNLVFPLPGHFLVTQYSIFFFIFFTFISKKSFSALYGLNIGSELYQNPGPQL